MSELPDKYAHVRLEGLELKPGEPWFLLRGQDRHTPEAMRAYARLRGEGTKAWLDILGHADAIAAWQLANPQYVHEPD